MSDYHKVIGIDLGTTFSVVAVYVLGKSEVTVIPNALNQRTTPSVVYIGKTGQISVGDAARQKLLRDPDGVVIEAKRLMGERSSDGKKQVLQANGRDCEPEFISACILKELKGYAEKFIGEPIHDAVITVPAYFKEPQKNATREAARLARLNPRLIVNEPTAAAVAYGLDDDEDSTFIVYDFGGGTFDVSIVRIKDGRQFDILGTGGDAQLGGGDIDKLIVDWALGNMRRDYGQDFSNDAKLIGKLRLEAERVKINLCAEDAVQQFFIDRPTKDIDEIEYFLAPGEFKKMIQPILDRTFKEVEVAMASAANLHGTSFDDVDAFILVGGSSKIPYVNQMLSEKFKKPVKADLNPDEIVAIGAARLAVDYPPSQAAELNGDAPLVFAPQASVPEGLTDPQIKDVVSHTLGIGLKDDVYDSLIEKDKYIPCSVTRKGYTTAQDNQTSIWVPVYQGDNPKASLNYSIGEVIIDNLPPEPAGHHQFEITFALDVDGIFFGQIVHQQTGERKDIKLQRGQDALVEKRRQEIIVMLERGSVEPVSTASGQNSNPITELLNQAKQRLNDLPATVQAELKEAIEQFERAVGTDNLREQVEANLKITSILSRYRN
jgi:molecular chaperone DnaK